MIYTTHLLFAFLLSLLFEKFLHLPVISSKSILFVFLGSLLPDIDHPRSYINRDSWRVIWLSGIMGTHRGWTHSIFGAFIFTFIFTLLLNQYILSFSCLFSFFLGYMSHLISDSFNPSRVPWFWPKKRRYGLDIIKTGSLNETFFQFVLLTLIFIVLSSSLYTLL